MIESLTLMAAVPVAIRSRELALRLRWPLLIGLVILVLQVPYVVVAHSTPLLGTTSEYLVAFARFYVFGMLVAIYATCFLHLELFIQIFWAIGRAVIMASMAAYVLHRLVGVNLLLNVYPDQVRLQGFFSEPSAFAPFLAAFLILAATRRSWPWLALGLIALGLTLSPTAFLTTGLTLPIYFSLTRRHAGARIRAMTAVVCALIPGFWLYSAIPAHTFLDSGSPELVAVGRLLSGLENVGTGGLSGTNQRFAGAVEVLDVMKTNDFLLTGYGLGSSAPYFLHRFGSPRDYSLFLTVLFSYGIFGLATFAALCFWALIRMTRTRSVYLTFYLPFLVAGAINSAESFASYQFVLIGLALAPQLRAPGSTMACSRGPLPTISSPERTVANRS